jgi:H+/Cl- antiporter ClcA
MPEKEIEKASTTNGLPIAPSLGPSLSLAKTPTRSTLLDRRSLLICLFSILLAGAAALIARWLMDLIGLVTNVSFYGTVSTKMSSPAGNHLGLWVIVIPPLGGIVVGLMARYGSAGIRGHGIPEAMERVLLHESRVPKRLTFLKPLSAAVAIGTGGPFGAEGPIIATGGALGSFLGQLIHTSAAERKTLLAAGAAAGMAATFGSPVSAVLLAVELLLFEFRPRSFIPVALAATTAASLRFAMHMRYPIFDLPALAQPGQAALLAYVVIGAIVGLASVGVTRAVYWMEDMFDHLHMHWMWWPVIGAIPVGIIGYFQPRTLGVGYENISDFLCGRMALAAVGALAATKFISWTVALSSGTSGGTLAPLFTIGSGLGALLGHALGGILPHWGIDPAAAALVGMAAMFAGASRAFLASVVFAFETTLQSAGLLPLLGGCAAAYLVSSLLMPNTIMTEKIARRGVRVPADYAADDMDSLLVRDVATDPCITLNAARSVGDVRVWLSSGAADAQHQGYPIVDDAGACVGVLTRRDLLNDRQDAAAPLSRLIQRPPVVVYADCTLRDAADHMVNHSIGRLPVLDRADRINMIGIITRSDLLKRQDRRGKRPG